MNKHLIGETIKTDVAFASANLTAGVTSPIYIDMATCQLIAAVVVVHLPAGKKIELQLKQAKNAAGLDAENLGTKVTVTNTGHARDVIARVEAQASSLKTNDGFTHVGVNADTDGAYNGAGIFIRYGLMFADGIEEVSLTDVNEVTTTAGD